MTIILILCCYSNDFHVQNLRKIMIIKIVKYSYVSNSEEITVLYEDEYKVSCYKKRNEAKVYN